MIEKNYNEVLVKQQPAARAIIQHLFDIDSSLPFENAAVYHEFPIYPKPDDETTMSANVVFLSQKHGMFIFECVEFDLRQEQDLNEAETSLDEIDSFLFAKILKDAPNLRGTRRHTLKFPFQSYVFVNNAENNRLGSSNFKTIRTKTELQHEFANAEGDEMSSEEFLDLKSTMEGSKGITKPAIRNVKVADDFENSKGAILSAIESEINTFDLEQKRAALFIVDGAQRIRGLAGSGKTVILAMKAAIIHLQYPKANILYTYYTKSLNEIVKNLITRFYRQFAERDPHWERIQIMHGWGGRNIDGVYYNTCKLNGIDPINLQEARNRSTDEPFSFVCGELIKNNLKQQFDYSLIDEAQDFPESFYRLCRQITNRNRVIWAYDDFQNILNTKIQDEKETFGKSPGGEYFIDFSRRENELQDMVLHRCYRTPRKILVSAFCLGLGVYNKKNDGESYQLVQRLSSNNHWTSLGFSIEEGDCIDGERMVISRSTSSSSEIKNRLLDDDSILRVHKADGIKNELEFIISSILEDLEKELRPEDISVVCMNNRGVKDYFKYIQNRLKQEGVESFNLLDAPSNNKFYKRPNHVTLSTIYKAKGNEAGSVYICSIDAVFSNKNSLNERNKIFTAMTRSKAWVTLSGIGRYVDVCKEELDTLKSKDYRLEFIQPSADEVQTIVHDIDKNQELLNEIERFKSELKDRGYSNEDIQDQMRLNFSRDEQDDI